MKEISAEALKNKLSDGSKGLRLIDVRTPAEYDQCHIEGTELQPLDRFEAEKVKAGDPEGARTILICKSGKRATEACRKLHAAGCTGATILTGGVEAWDAEGYAVQRSERKIIPLERQVRIAAGALALLGAILGFTVNPLWHILPGFVGAGLLHAGLTDTCGMGMMLAKMPWNQHRPARQA